jgi:hypothetical protein
MTTLANWTAALYQVASFECALLAASLLTGAILALIFGALFLRPKNRK